MHRDDLLDVLVVGAGPVGLALAHGLRRYGLDVAIIDALEAPTTQSRATDLQPRTLEQLSTWGVADELVTRGRKVRGVRFHSLEREVFRLGFEQLETPYPFLLSLPQPVTERVFAEALAGLGTSVGRGLRLDALDDQGERVVATVVSKGEARSLAARYLVGCDGASSTVRELIGVGFEGHAIDRSFVVADVELTSTPPSDEIALFMHPSGFLTLLSLPGDGVFRLFFDMPEGAREAPSHEALQRLVDERSCVGLHIKQVTWSSVFTVQQRMAGAFQKGSVFLAGNAAHVHSPAGGQGMNIGLQDAANLAWKLALVQRGVARPELLTTYDDERRAVARVVLAETELATMSTMLQSPVARALRDAAARLGGLVRPLARRIEQRCAELDFSYDQSLAVDSHRAPLLTAPVVDDRTTERASLADRARFEAGPHAGSRAPLDGPLWVTPTPDAPPRTSTLHELLRHPGFTLLLFDGEARTAAGYDNLRAVASLALRWLGEHLRTVIVAYGSEPPPLFEETTVISDHGGKLHRLYGASSECLYLIRPDGHIGFRCQPASADELEAFFEGMFVKR